jgi:hypothetical protein
MPIDCERIFTRQVLDQIFPPQRADQFFDALLGDADEGAYDIRLACDGLRGNELIFNLELHQRPGKCLACNLTYGLPTVFSRHPVIDLKAVVAQIDSLLDGQRHCGAWELGATQEVSRQLHIVPLRITLLSPNQRA